MSDFNLDLLNDCSSDFKDIMHAISLYPLITRPTRITTHSSTVIDNIFTSLIKEDPIAGIIIADISDHLPTFDLYRLGEHRKHTSFLYINGKLIIIL